MTMKAGEVLKKWDTMSIYEKMAVKREYESRRAHDPILSQILPELLADSEQEVAETQKAAQESETAAMIRQLQDYIIKQATVQNDIFRLSMDLQRRVEHLETSILVVKRSAEGAKLFAPQNDRMI